MSSLAPVSRPERPVRPLRFPEPDRRRHRRAPVTLTGRLLDDTGAERACRTEDVSPGGASLAGAAAPPVGSKLIIYLNDIGRLEARVVRVDGPDRFAVRFEVSTRRRERIAETLILALNAARFAGQDSTGAETRRGRRYEGEGALKVELEDGTIITCSVLDFSLVGASLKCERAPPRLNSWVRVGPSYGRVARYIEHGFAVDFEPRTGALAPR